MQLGLKSKNKITVLNNIEGYLLDMVNTSNSGYVSEDGVVERWVGGTNKEEWTKEIKKYTNKTREKFKKELDDSKRT